MVKVNLGFGKASYGTVAEKDSNTGKYQPVENSSLAKNDSTVIGAISSEGFLVFLSTQTDDDCVVIVVCRLICTEVPRLKQFIPTAILDSCDLDRWLWPHVVVVVVVMVTDVVMSVLL